MTFAPANLMATTTEYLTQGVPSNLTFPFSVVSGMTTQRITPRHAFITVEGNAVRYGLNPTVTTGTIVPVGGQIDFTRQTDDFSGILRQVQFIALNGNSTLQVQFLS